MPPGVALLKGHLLAALVVHAHFAQTRLAIWIYLRRRSASAPPPSRRSAMIAHRRELDQHWQVDRQRPPSTFAPFITEIERLEGVPPNMSVKRTTPCRCPPISRGVHDIAATLFHVVVGDRW